MTWGIRELIRSAGKDCPRQLLLWPPALAIVPRLFTSPFLSLPLFFREQLPTLFCGRSPLDFFRRYGDQVIEAAAIAILPSCL